MIIENKTFSDLNGRKTDDTTQVSTYYKWGDERKNERNLQLLCFITCPDSRKDELQEKIEKEKMNGNYRIVTYGEIADFIRKRIDEKYYNDYPFVRLINDIELAFRYHSYTSEQRYAIKFRKRTL